MEETPVIPAYVTLAEGTIASDYALKNLNKSLGEAQNEFTPASKGEENKWGGYKYTSLENIIKAVRPALTKHHLTVSQFSIVDLELKTIRLVTRLVHWDSGEWMQNNLDLPAELALGKDGAPKFNQQTIGGSSTYAQKYAYKTILGIPDSEEMIDSSEEKGDLPARSKAQKAQPKQTAEQFGPGPDEKYASSMPAAAQTQSSVRSQFFGKAKEYGWGLGEIKQYLIKLFGEASTAKLTEKQLQDTLEAFSQVKPEEFFAPQEESAA